ncbi:type VI secretion system baseplate subunit TssK [Hymenobacter sp. GOD-10R]|uniref:type VI secretion system baseplate subunit TssK n=1 Tax=Hymenobacter sp. GOD-10R TaxID=3093922 RepID=UPI002D78679D|nr:type VI secretion system baseplate subunit TssK [Hymenobacter sp. GOD-10R]WRQ31269.1 type VI secretion system baseplate subunit TssK [Hymenobacter sp. GOD-10R]
MLVAKNYFAVNWVDGMKLSQQHFLDTDLQVQDLVRDTASLFLTDYNFGLLPPVKGATVSSEIELLEKVGNSVEVRLARCNAITAGGCRIAINPESAKYTALRAAFRVDTTVEEAQRASYDIILTVNPFRRVPLGTPDPEESPMRHPFTDSYYDLKVVHTAQINADELGAHFLTIGRIMLREGRYVVDENFIPPCTSMNSHSRLMKYYKDFGYQLNQLQINSFKIVRKIYDRQQASTISRSIEAMCTKVLDYLCQIFFNYRSLDYQHPPVHLLDYFNNLASMVYTGLYCMPAKDKEELLNYFYEWTDVTPNYFESMLLNLVEMTYTHHNIGASMQTVEDFLAVMVKLWARLSGLEYIGQHKENILIREEAPSRPTLTTRNWSLLD